MIGRNSRNQWVRKSERRIRGESYVRSATIVVSNHWKATWIRVATVHAVAVVNLHRSSIALLVAFTVIATAIAAVIVASVSTVTRARSTGGVLASSMSLCRRQSSLRLVSLVKLLLGSLTWLGLRGWRLLRLRLRVMAGRDDLAAANFSGHFDAMLLKKFLQINKRGCESTNTNEMT